MVEKDNHRCQKETKGEATYQEERCARMDFSHPYIREITLIGSVG